jgi:glycine hydroxymethyltransferase
MNGLRFGTPEIVRWGMTPTDMPKLAKLVTRALETNDPASLAAEVAEWRQSFDRIHFVN